MTFTCDTIAVGISGKKLRIPLAPFLEPLLPSFLGCKGFVLGEHL
jgi:hypothetical protein